MSKRPMSASSKHASSESKREKNDLAATQSRFSKESDQENIVKETKQRNCNSERDVSLRKESDRSRSTSSSYRSSARSSSYSRSHSSDRDLQHRGNSLSPGRNIGLETHLKNSNNPALRKWVKEKDKEYRRKKTEERKKKREEREEKQAQENKKKEISDKGQEKVKEWMVKKRKEAYITAKEERRRKKLEAEEEERRRSMLPDYSGIFKTRSLDKPNETADDVEKDVDSASTVPLAQSKFVYKRAVSGRVRLMKLQQESKENTKKSEKEKREMEKKLEEEKAKKMRVSYDQWLIQKRETEYTKRQEAARQRELAKSDPELERIIPEVARRRINNIKNSRKRIDTGLFSPNEKINKSFGGSEFDTETVENSEYLDSLLVSGSKKTIRQRPASAKPTQSKVLPNPKLSKSPRRPKSANPRVQSSIDAESKNGKTEHGSGAFRLPFPPEHGVPKYVDQRQKKLFSDLARDQSASWASDAVGETDTSLETSMILEASDLPIKAQVSDQEGEINGELEQKTLVGEHIDSSKDNPSDTEAGKSFFVTENFEDTEIVSEDKELQQVTDNANTDLETTADKPIDIGNDYYYENIEATKRNGLEDDVKENIDEENRSSDVNSGNEDGPEGNNVFEKPPTIDSCVKGPVESGDVDEEMNGEETTEYSTNNSVETDKSTLENVNELLLNLGNEEQDESSLYLAEGGNSVTEEKNLPDDKAGARFLGKSVSFKEEAEVFETEHISYETEDSEELLQTLDDEDDEAEDVRGGYYDTPREDDEF